MSEYIQICNFRDVNINDSFFDSLKADYVGFEDWFQRKSHEEAYVFVENGNVHGFLYLKVEEEGHTDITPNLPPRRRVKIGTFKIDAHGTKLGERFLKKSIDFAVSVGAISAYATCFDKHESLIKLFEEFGFVRFGEKRSDSGVEGVFAKSLVSKSGTLRQTYPLINLSGTQKHLLSIRPDWHSQLFPDSILNNENYDILSDVSHTNSIMKSYVCFMDMSSVRPGDYIIIYRMSDKKGPAEYRSVATSVCQVEEIRERHSFGNVTEFIAFTERYSVFSEAELKQWWESNQHRPLYSVRMLYNAAFSKRLIRQALADQVGLDRNTRWGILQLTDEQFRHILKLGGVNARIVID